MLTIVSQKRKSLTGPKPQDLLALTNDPLPGFDFITGEHPRYTSEYWKSEVAYNLTRMGYWQWVRKHIYDDESDARWAAMSEEVDKEQSKGRITPPENL